MYYTITYTSAIYISKKRDVGIRNASLLEKVHSVYFEYEENSTHDRLLSLDYAFCHIKRLIKTSEPVYTD